MRTLTVNFKIVTSVPADEPLGEFIAYVLKEIAEHADIKTGAYESGAEYKFTTTLTTRNSVITWVVLEGQEQLRGKIVADSPPLTLVARVTATYENEYT